MFKIFKNIKKQFLEEWKNFENRLLESNSFNLFKERYQALNIFYQKLIKYLFVFFVFSALAYLPFSYFFSSADYWGEFKEKQELSLKLLKMRKKISFSAFRFSQEQLKSQIDRIVSRYSASDFTVKEKRSVLPEAVSIDQIDFDIQVKHLNIKQTVKLGTELHNLSQAHLSSITMEENKKFPKHYNTTYKVSAFISKEKRLQRKIIRPRSKKALIKNKNLETKKSRGLKKKTKDRLKAKEDSNLDIEKKARDNIRTKQTPKSEAERQEEAYREEDIKNKLFPKLKGFELEESDLGIESFELKGSQ